MTIGRIPSVEGGIQPTIVDAKGDLIAATAADTVNRLAVGSNDQVLVADSTQSTGLAWKSYGAQFVAGKNAAINGGQDIWQRGTSFTTNAAYVYCSDRWYYSRSAGNTTVSRQTDAPSGFQYSIRLARNSGDTNTSGFTFHQALETSESMRFASQTVTFSFWAKAGANYSAGAIPTYINTGTGTDQAATGQNAGTWTGFTSPLNGSTFTPTTSWVRYSFTATIGSTATQIGFGFITPSFSGTAGANDWIQFTGLQFEVGSTATPFSRAGGTIQGERSACERYFYRTTFDKHFTLARDANIMWFQFKNPTTMRTDPAISSSLTTKVAGAPANSAQVGFYSNGAFIAGTSAITLNVDSAKIDEVSVYYTGATFTQGTIATAAFNGAYFDVSAEL